MVRLERHDDDVDDDRGMVEIPGGKKENSNWNAGDSFSPSVRLAGWVATLVIVAGSISQRAQGEFGHRGLGSVGLMCTTVLHGIP